MQDKEADVKQIDYREKRKPTPKAGSKEAPSESHGGLLFDLSANASENKCGAARRKFKKKKGNPNRRGKRKEMKRRKAQL